MEYNLNRIEVKDLDMVKYLFENEAIVLSYGKEELMNLDFINKNNVSNLDLYIVPFELIKKQFPFERDYPSPFYMVLSSDLKLDPFYDFKDVIGKGVNWFSYLVGMNTTEEDKKKEFKILFEQKISQTRDVNEYIDKEVKSMNDNIKFYSTQIDRFNRFGGYHNSIRSCVNYIEEISKCTSWEEAVEVEIPGDLLR